jgi:hypothetical protein
MGKKTPEMLRVVNDVLTDVVSENLRWITGYRVLLVPHGFQISLYAERLGRTFAVDCTVSAMDLISSPSAAATLRNEMQRYVRMLQVKTTC